MFLNTSFKNWKISSIQLIKGNRLLSFEENECSFQNKNNEFQFSFKFQKSKKIDRIEISLQAKVNLGEAVINGFQSWSECQVANNNAVQRNLFPLAKPLMAKSGDYTFYPYRKKKNSLHSWHYIQFLPNKNDSNNYFLGALSPQKAYTSFDWFEEENKLVISQFCERKFEANEVYSFSILEKSGVENDIYTDFFNRFPAKNTFEKTKKFTGWTSWYLHYTNIDESIITSNLNNFIERNIPIDYFQIDDGWQISIGNWNCNEKFPNGLQKIVETAKANNIKPGLWLAPFIAEKNSFIFKEKKDWLLKNNLGKPIKMTYNPLWSGWFYAIDFYNLEARSYIAETLQRVTKEWGFSLLKLDFLYAVGIVPQHNKSRGEVMWEAMVWLREQLKDVEILGCGVPLNSACGNTDFCRIGPDVSESWDVNWLAMVNHAERLSTKNAIRNSILRFPIDHKAFRNDPDVFILREKNQHLSETQQFTLYIINQLFGNLIFTSDDIATYGKTDMQLYKQQFPAKNIEIIKARIYDKLLIVEAKTQFATLKLFTNLDTQKQSVSTFENEYLIQNNLALIFPKFFTLEAFETKIFTQVNKQKNWQLASSNIHLFTGNGIDFISDGKDILIKKNEQAIAGNITIYSKTKQLVVNRKVYEGRAVKNDIGYLVEVDLS